MNKNFEFILELIENASDYYVISDKLRVVNLNYKYIKGSFDCKSGFFSPKIEFNITHEDGVNDKVSINIDHRQWNYSSFTHCKNITKDFNIIKSNTKESISNRLKNTCLTRFLKYKSELIDCVLSDIYYVKKYGGTYEPITSEYLTHLKEVELINILKKKEDVESLIKQGYSND